MDFDQRHLRAFLAVADEKSLGRAARAIHLSQPALSRLIQSMEVRLSAKLFDRHPKGMLLTVFGEALLPHARALVFENEQAMAALDRMRGLERGTVRIGAVASVARAFLPDIVRRFLTERPGIRIELLEANDLALLQKS